MRGEEGEGERQRGLEGKGKEGIDEGDKERWRRREKDAGE